MLETLLKSVRSKHQEKPISPDAYHKWRMSGVTRRMLEEVEVELLDKLSEGYPGSIEERALKTARNEGLQEMSEQILNWKPLELVENPDE